LAKVLQDCGLHSSWKLVTNWKTGLSILGRYRLALSERYRLALQKSTKKQQMDMRMNHKEHYRTPFSQEHVCRYTSILPWRISYDLVHFVRDGNWKPLDGNPSVFVYTRYGALKMYNFSREALLDDCMKDGRWKTRWKM